MAYAKDTNVAVSKSKGQIENMLMGYGSDSFASMNQRGKGAAIGFRRDGMAYQILLPLPDPEEFRMTPTGKYERHPDDMMKHWEQACRSKWRALFLVIKAKIEAVEAGISEFEIEFLPFFVCGTGKTLWQEALPKIQDLKSLGEANRLMLPEAL